MILDIFKNDAFNLTGMTAAIDRQPYVPGAVGKLGIFEEEGIYTTTLEVEERQGRLYLVPTTPRGGPAFQNTRDPRDVRYFKTLHLPVRDRVGADELQNKRVFGTDDQLAAVKDEVDGRLAKIKRGIDATIEYGRLGALKGVITDADGVSVLYNLFTEFGLAQQSEDYQLGDPNGSPLAHAENVRGMIQDALGADGSEDIEVVALCGKTWFARFLAQPKVAEAYKYYQSVAANLNPLQMDLRYKGFKYGDVTYKVYRGQVNGVPFVNANEVAHFPVGIAGLYKTYYAPADYVETANTKGRPYYAKQAPDPSGFNKFVQIEAQSNPISLCLRPDVLIKGTTSN